MRDSTLLKRGKWKYIEYTYRDSSPKNENSVINYSPSCRSKPVRPSFIFGTQIKIFLIKSKSSLTLHRQQHNWNVPRSRNIARTSVRESMWHQGFNRNFTKLREYVLCAKKTKITTLFNNSSPPHPVCCGSPPLWKEYQDTCAFYRFM